MSLMYTEEQKALIALVKEMAENEIKPYVKDADEKGECPKELYKWGFDMGLHMLEVPAEYGGAGLSYETTARNWPRWMPVMPSPLSLLS